MSNWSKFDNMDVASINDELKELNDSEYPEVPDGKYEVEIVSMELKPTKKDGFPMLSVQFKIVAGEYKKQRLFMNQVLLRGNQNDKYSVNGCNRFLKSLGTSVAVQFEGVSAYDAMIGRIFGEIQEEGLQYLIEMTDKKGFKNFEIKEVYEAE